MERSIGQVARMAGVSARTLRHYDHLGLLRPSRVAANGYRWYGREQVRRLQRILVLREVDVPLATIGELLDSDGDEATALRAHRDAVAAERDRLDRVVATLDRTLAAEAADEDLDDAAFFDGLERRRDRIADHLTQRYGAAVGEGFLAATGPQRSWSRQRFEEEAARGRQLLASLSSLRAAGVPPDSERALDAVAEHHAGVVATWPADPAAYHALGEVIAFQPDQRAMLGEQDAALPDWLGAAVRAYAVRRLGHTPPPAAAEDSPQGLHHA